jgi:hypothetical protein
MVCWDLGMGGRRKVDTRQADFGQRLMSKECSDMALQLNPCLCPPCCRPLEAWTKGRRLKLAIWEQHGQL